MSVRRNRAYHDRVAARYDEIYQGPRWQAWFEVSWRGIKPYLPASLDTEVADLGCGTGRYGLRLAKSGYRVMFSDLSGNMVERSRRKAGDQGVEDRCEFVQADVMDLKELGRSRFGLAVAQGDPISFAEKPGKALAQIRRILQPGGVLVASVDQRYAAIDYYAERADLDGVEALLNGGTIEWLAHDKNERFPVNTFTAESLQTMLAREGFEMLDLYAKTVLPWKKLEGVFDDPAKLRRLIAMERKHCRKPSVLGRAGHLQFAARRPAGD